MPAASSGGVDWTELAKELLSAYYSTFKPKLFNELVEAIIENKIQILQAEDVHIAFFTAFASLSADYISSNIAHVRPDQIEEVCKACVTLLEHLIWRMYIFSTKTEDRDMKCPYTKGSCGNMTLKYLLLPVKAMCTGTNQLQRSDVLAISAVINESTKPHPPAIIEKEVNDEKSSSLPDGKQTKCGLKNLILHQLITPLGKSPSANLDTASSIASVEVSTGQDLKYIQDTFVKLNGAHISKSKLSDVLLSSCQRLSKLQDYFAKCNACLKENSLVLNIDYNEAITFRHSLSSLVQDIFAVWTIFSLPIYEPLSEERLLKIANVSLGCLYCSVYTATAMSLLSLPPVSRNSGSLVAPMAKAEDDFSEIYSGTVVEKSIEIFRILSDATKTSTRAGGYVHQNFLMIGSWIITCGLRHHVSVLAFHDEDKSKMIVKDKEHVDLTHLYRAQQGFSVLSTALLTHALSIMTIIFEDGMIESAVVSKVPKVAPLDILYHSTSAQRIARLLEISSSKSKLQFFLLLLMPIVYRKACTMRHSTFKSTVTVDGADTLSASDSTTYYEDELMSCSEPSSPEDEDTEPMLGQWIEDTMNAVEASCNAVKAKADQSSETEDVSSKNDDSDVSSFIIPDKMDPSAYMKASAALCKFMDSCFVMNELEFVVESFKNSINEQCVIMMSAVIRDLDREAALVKTLNGCDLVYLFREFSEALMHFTHNLLARSILVAPLDEFFVTSLGVSPSTDETIPWPLQIYPRTLSVLIRVLMLSNKREESCSLIWSRLIKTLGDKVITSGSMTDINIEDLNVEHAQLLLFLYHSLTFSNKKAVLINLGKTIASIGQADIEITNHSQIMYISRLLLFFDYMLKHLYDPPSFVLDQIVWNTLSDGIHGVVKSEGKEKQEIYYPWLGLEENLRKNGNTDTPSNIPNFYNLAYMGSSLLDIPKVDHLALGFFLGNTGEWTYHDLITTILKVVSIIDVTEKPFECDKYKFNTLCSVQYAVSLAWRLLMEIPMSLKHLENISASTLVQANPLMPFVLYTIVWGGRSRNRLTLTWLKDSFAKQSVHNIDDSSLTELMRFPISVKHTLSLLKEVISGAAPYMKSYSNKTPTKTIFKLASLKQEEMKHLTLHQIMCIDVLASRLQIMLDNSAYEKIVESLNILDPSATPFVEDTCLVDTAEVLPYILLFTENIYYCIRSNLVKQMKNCSKEFNLTEGDLNIFESLCGISNSSLETPLKGSELSLVGSLPSFVTHPIQQFTNLSVSPKKSPFLSLDGCPLTESSMQLIDYHISTLSASFKYSTSVSLKRLMFIFMSLIKENLSVVMANQELKAYACSLFTTINLDLAMTSFTPVTREIMKQIVGDEATDVYHISAYSSIFEGICLALEAYCSNTKASSKAVNDQLILVCVQWLSRMFGIPLARSAIDKYLTSQTDEFGLHSILFTVTHPRTSISIVYSKHLLGAFNKLFIHVEEERNDAVVSRLIESLFLLLKMDKTMLDLFMWGVVAGAFVSDKKDPVKTKDEEKQSSLDEENDEATKVKLETFTEAIDIEMYNEISAVLKKKPLKTKVEELKLNETENFKFLRYISQYIINGWSKTNMQDAASILVRSMIPANTHLLHNMKAVGFPELFHIMRKLSYVANPKGDYALFVSSITWLEDITRMLERTDLLRTLQSYSTLSHNQQVLMESACLLMNHLSDVLCGLCYPVDDDRMEVKASELTKFAQRLKNSFPERFYVGEDNNTETIIVDELDNESMVNKLCTFTMTQKEFSSQHWYHCHTCKMTDKTGVCSVCARVCHIGHDVTYAKYGNFFCDCGARNNGGCKALSKRTPLLPTSGAAQEIPSPSTRDCGPSHGSSSNLATADNVQSPPMDCVRGIKRETEKLNLISRKLESLKDLFVSHLTEKPDLVNNLIKLLEKLLPSIETYCREVSPVGSHKRVKFVMNQIAEGKKFFEYCDSLVSEVTPTNSQELTVECGHIIYNGDQGQTIRQLITTHLIKRVSMCVMSSVNGKKQHLVTTSHEKGKLIVYQMDSALAHLEDPKKKIALTKLSTNTIPFTVLTLSSNQLNEDYLAVCGLKDCHILSFSPNGCVSEHLILQPQLESGNYIMRAIWLPGTQTWLALVTADFIKIYDLSKDVLSPQYYFIVPTGKVRDVTFMVPENGNSTIVIMSSSGYVYTQELCDDSSAANGPFYVTNTLQLEHPSIKENVGQLCGGGVSVYFSHLLRLMFLSFVDGKTFMAFFGKNYEDILSLHELTLPNRNNQTNNSVNSGTGKSPSTPQPLYLWYEILSHPGMVFAMIQGSHSPVVFMLTTFYVIIQEVKLHAPKAKVSDCVVTRHTCGGDERKTTMIVMCEDENVRFLRASSTLTDFWMTSYIKPISKMAPKLQLKPGTSTTKSTSKTTTFPIDFFENSAILNDLEYSGKDLLQFYSAQIIKHRLSTPGLYVVCAKTTPFTVTVTNLDTSQLITGFRVYLGSQTTSRSPSYIEACGRTIRTGNARNRWYDVPLNDEESLRLNNTLTITFGVSQDPDSLTVIDSIKVHGRPRDQFSGIEEVEEPSNASAATSSTAAASSDSVTKVIEVEKALNEKVVKSMTIPLDRLTCSVMETLECIFSLMTYSNTSYGDSIKYKHISDVKRLSSSILTLPSNDCIQVYNRALLSSLYTNKQSYHLYKDRAIISYALSIKKKYQNVEDGSEIDPEEFYHVILNLRNIATSRPQNFVFENIVSFSTKPLNEMKHEERKVGQTAKEIMKWLMEIMWLLLKAKVQNNQVIYSYTPGLIHVEPTMASMVDIIKAFVLCDQSEETVDIVTRYYLDLLMSEDTTVCFAAKQMIIRSYTPKLKHIKSNKKKSEPNATTKKSERRATSVQSQPSQESSELDVFHPVAQGGLIPANMPSLPLDALLPEDAVFPHLDLLQGEADDETMVELAIALSLQEHDQANGLQVMQQELQVDVVDAADVVDVVDIADDTSDNQAGEEDSQMLDDSQPQELGHFSDTTASAGPSDDDDDDVEDEVSTAATDGSTIRTSQTDQGDSCESESGGSTMDSVIYDQTISGGSSAFGGSLQDIKSCVPQETEEENDNNSSKKIHTIRVLMLERLIKRIPDLKVLGGLTAIPMMQVIFALTVQMNGQTDKEVEMFNDLLKTLLKELDISVPTKLNPDYVNPVTFEPTPHEKYRLILFRFLSLLLSHCKIPCPKTGGVMSNKFIIHTTCEYLDEFQVGSWCLELLKELLPHWKREPVEDPSSHRPIGLLRPNVNTPPPDMQPFFLRQYIKQYSSDIFELHTQLLTEIALRLPYQINKYGPYKNTFVGSWYKTTCDYMLLDHVPSLKKQLRKILLCIGGSKEAYRHLKDVHTFDTHIETVFKICGMEDDGSKFVENVPENLNLSYNRLVEIVKNLKSCIELTMNRFTNWQRFLIQDKRTGIPRLLALSCVIGENVATIILQMVQFAALGPKQVSSHSSKSGISKADTQSVQINTRKGNEGKLRSDFVSMVHATCSRQIFKKFIEAFLLETNVSQLRWQAHNLMTIFFLNASRDQQEALLDLMWSLWHRLPSYGRKARLFVDLIGYFTCINFGSAHKMRKAKKKQHVISHYIDEVVQLLRSQNKVLMEHQNAALYTQLSQYVEVDGYYVESEPCLVCNNPEVPYSQIKLSSIKADYKYTTTTHIVKLVVPHIISRVIIRISDLKRSKMVRSLNLYYNNRTVQAVVELKNKPVLWQKAQNVTIASGQTEVKIEFPLPITACNLMIEYSDFYENLQASTETLQCPRCSTSVTATPGICSNCGENVYQCHKCRAINYDEKDPFLCHVCGFCKYAKFDHTIVGRQSYAIEPVDSDEDRKKVMANINTLLERADRSYKQLMVMKPNIEALLMKISEHRLDAILDETLSSAVGVSSSSQINKAIQLLAQRYCIDCKNTFDELSKIIQKILVCRRELVSYDRKQVGLDIPDGKKSYASLPSDNVATGRCYGCASFVVQHCLTLLKALALNSKTRSLLSVQGLIRELVEKNLRKGPSQVQEEVRQLLCLLVRDNAKMTTELCNLLMERIMLPLRGHSTNPELAYSVRADVTLFGILLQKDDSCWEIKARCVTRLLLLACTECRSPATMDSVVLPCLNVLQSLVKPESATSKKNKGQALKNITTIRAIPGISVNVDEWINDELGSSFESWRCRMPKKKSTVNLPEDKKKVREWYLAEKYFARWMEEALQGTHYRRILLKNPDWLKAILFSNTTKRARDLVCKLIESLCDEPTRTKQVIDMLTGFLSEVSKAGSNSSAFLSLYGSLIQQSHWKECLTLRGVLVYLSELFTKEIEMLHHLEETTYTSDLAQGFVLKKLTQIIASFLEVPTIKQRYKSRLVGAVLNGYLSLRRLVVQRTKTIDETQEKLLSILEDITSGTDEETKEFMIICIKTVEKCSLSDVKTPLFIFERICSIIYPDENEIGDFYLSLEKDPQQEDFLQGRMVGNPYSSGEQGLGPLMRDVKNKICRDCELVALLEDDNGMELLVNNKIISLDLPVKQVYKKVWVAEGGDGDVMRVVYRMRGLLGDATEEFVETLTATQDGEVNNEQVYRMANVMAESNGLKVMITRLKAIKDLNRCQGLLQVLLKLLSLCVKVKRNQEVLIKREMSTMSVLLNILQKCLKNNSNDAAHTQLTDQLLQIMETILSRASFEYQNDFQKFSDAFEGSEHIKSILENTSKVKPNVLNHLSKILASLTYGNIEKMTILTDYFRQILLFELFDHTHTSQDEQKFELLCNITAGIERNPLGNTLKDHFFSLRIVDKALSYIEIYAPSLDSNIARPDNDDWKDYISKPSLKYILRMLTGLADQHKPTQLAFSDHAIEIIHHLEQVSSDEHVGTLAENLLEALRTNQEVATRIENVRERTRAEKKRLAMAMREKQLGALGMRTNEKGQVTAETSVLEQVEDLGDETGLICVICREGYKFQPTKTLGIYTFTKRCLAEEYETKPRKTYGYTTVTHFNIVHIDCHLSAIRLVRVRDEWESAALQNANTKCNGLMPLWGPNVTESAFASNLARHNTYIHETTGNRDIGHYFTLHDLKLLLLRFARGKTFHDDTGGGGPQSNMMIVPYLLHTALYVINTTRCHTKEMSNLTTYLESSPSERWLSTAYEVDGPLYMAVLSMAVRSYSSWKKDRLIHLKRLILLAHVRDLSSAGPVAIKDPTPKSYDVYKCVLMFFTIIDLIYKYHLSPVPDTTSEPWAVELAKYIRHNDEALIKASETVIAEFTDFLMPCTSFEEFCDAAGLLNDIESPSTFIAETLSLVKNVSMTATSTS